MRIAIVGLSIEIMLASPQPTDWDAVQHYSSRDIAQGDVWMIRGMLDRLKTEPGVEAVPLYWATALPGGAMTAEAYGRIKDKTLDLLREQGPFDGVLVANHGALEVTGLGLDADTDFIGAVRACVGPDVPIGVALDLHGDMTPDLLRAATVFSVLRTAPHRDDRQTGFRAADQLLRVLRQGLKPRKAAVSIPILLPGEIAVTNLPPADELYGGLAALDGRDGLMESNILVGFAWNDRPWTAVTAVAVSDGDPDVARRAAMDLASRIWDRRHDFRLRMETAEVEEGLRRAMECPERPVYVSDSGDNTTAGAAGDLTLVLQAALRDPRVSDIVVAGITAPRTVERLTAAGVGSEIEIELGAEHISRPRTAMRVLARVEACGATLDLPGFQPYRSVESAWARVSIGGVQATFHARSIGITTPHHLRAMGVDPAAHKAYVVKLGYLHPQLEDIRARHILLLSDGTSQLDMTRLRWSALPRPTMPLDGDFDWRAADALYTD
ncbi:M81 family metallopeptidase [Labrys wisconsinensis]|uniref:Microcystin degradation protein MlrC n=1 Tax=Labrys wisconsinensis TaxID=425677 RepID=A0ABU0JED7_9HYPH|nr:M81 family metallopeptidase [Labrys wisconsinensis]MDQ0471778.1 microcystin degradation protein MlrC [Labrys wisconsinensis]